MIKLIAILIGATVLLQGVFWCPGQAPTDPYEYDTTVEVR